METGTQPEIGQFDVPIDVNQDVVGFDVTSEYISFTSSVYRDACIRI